MKNKKFLWWLATVEAPHILVQYPHLHMRYNILGYSVIITWILAIVSWSCFFYFQSSNTLISFFLGMILGTLIMLIDRLLISSMKTGSFRQLTFRAFFGKISLILVRLLLATLIGMFVSQPLTLFIFKDDIAVQVNLDKAEKENEKKNQLDELYANQIEKLTYKIETLREQDRVEFLDVKRLESEYIGEADGTSGTGSIGYSTITNAKKELYLKADSSYREHHKDRLDQIAQNDSSLRQIESKKSKVLNEFIEKELSFTGYFDQTSALNNLMVKRPELTERYNLILMIILLFEVIPVFAKMILSKSVYEEKLEELENREKGKIDVILARDDKIANLKKDKIDDLGGYSKESLQSKIDEVLEVAKYRYNFSEELETLVKPDKNTRAISQKHKNLFELILIITILILLVFITNSQSKQWMYYISLVSILYSLVRDLLSNFKSMNI